MKTNLVIALLLTLVGAGTVAAQPASFNDAGVTMGHWHLVSKDVEANKKLFLAMAYHRLGQAKESCAWFVKAKLDKIAGWQERLIFQRLRQEAASLLPDKRQPRP